MPAPYFAHLNEEKDLETIESYYHTAKDGRLKERLLMVLLSLKGKRVSEIAKIVHRHEKTVLTWLHRFNEKGIEGLEDKDYSGRPPTLNEQEIQEMLDWILETVQAGNCLTCNQIAHWVEENFGKEISSESVRRILRQNGYSYKKPSVEDHRADPQEQEKFRQELNNRMENEPDKRFFFCDEVIFQLNTTTKATWAPQWLKFVLPGNLSHKKIIQISAIEPESGESFHVWMPKTTKVTFEIFVSELGKAFPNDSIVLITDNASWHDIESPCNNVEFMKLPPYSPWTRKNL